MHLEIRATKIFLCPRRRDITSCPQEDSTLKSRREGAIMCVSPRCFSIMGNCSLLLLLSFASFLLLVSRSSVFTQEVRLNSFVRRADFERRELDVIPKFKCIPPEIMFSAQRGLELLLLSLPSNLNLMLQFSNTDTFGEAGDWACSCSRWD